MKGGDLVYSVHIFTSGQRGLGLVTDTCDISTLQSGSRVDPPLPNVIAQGVTMFFISWVDNTEPSWYYSNEVERVDATRRSD